MSLQNRGFADGKLGPGSCFSSPLMIHIVPGATPNTNDELLNRVQSILKENLRTGPGKQCNPFYTNFLALVEQRHHTQGASGYPVIGMHALPAIDDAMERGPRHTDAPSMPNLMDHTVALALNIDQKSTNQLIKGATFDIGNLYLRGDVLVARSDEATLMLVATREGIQKKNLRVSIRVCK